MKLTSSTKRRPDGQVEVTPRFDKKDKLTLSVELTDFSVYYSQCIADSIAAELKEGKSEVVCDQGHLWKISKDKDGVVTRDKLTKQWTDWVDYWAVDFDYEKPQGNHQRSTHRFFGRQVAWRSSGRWRTCHVRRSLDRRIHLRE